MDLNIVILLRNHRIDIPIHNFLKEVIPFNEVMLLHFNNKNRACSVEIMIVTQSPITSQLV